MGRKALIAAAVVLLALVVLYLAFPSVVFRLVVDLERWSADLSKRSVAVGDHTVVYLEGGRGETILLVHGFSGSKDNWNRMAKHLTPSFHVVAMDLPGFGESTKRPNASYTIGAQIERLDEFVRALALKTFHLVGSSMGGTISGGYAIRFPDKVSSLGLFDTGGAVHCRKKGEWQRSQERGQNPLLIKRSEDFDAAMELTFVKPPWMPGAIRRALAAEWMESGPFNEKVFHALRQEGYSLEPALSEIKVRTLILWGEGDRLNDVSCAEVLQRVLPNAATVIMKDCGHMPMMERPEETARLYLGFLRKR